jgi:uncharacterized membrane protein
MSTNRPKLKVQLQTVDIAIELASIALLLLMWLHAITEYSNLPDTIATHFNGSGKADDYSSKVFIWLLPTIATILYAGLFYLNRFPHIQNYMVNITEENALKQYRFSTRMLRIVNFFCVLLMGYISYHIIFGAANESSSLGNGFLFVVIGGSVLLPIIILVFQKKLNKNEKH